MEKTTIDANKCVMLPAKGYVEGLGRARKGMLIAELMLTTGVKRTSVWRRLNGKVRPTKVELDIYAFSISKHTKSLISAEELFPASYPYSGTNKKHTNNAKAN